MDSKDSKKLAGIAKDQVSVTERVEQIQKDVRRQFKITQDLLETMQAFVNWYFDHKQAIDKMLPDEAKQQVKVIIKRIHIIAERIVNA